MPIEWSLVSTPRTRIDRIKPSRESSSMQSSEWIDFYVVKILWNIDIVTLWNIRYQLNNKKTWFYLMSDFQGCGHECTPVSWLSKGTRESICWTNQMQVHAWTGPEHGLNSAFPSSLGSLQRRSCRWWCLLSSSPQKWWSRESARTSFTSTTATPSASQQILVRDHPCSHTEELHQDWNNARSQVITRATGSHRHLRPICMPFVTVCSPSLFCCCRLRGNTFQILQSRKNMKSYLQIRRGTVWLAPQSLQLGYLQTLLHWSDSRALVKGCQGMSRDVKG